MMTLKIHKIIIAVLAVALTAVAVLAAPRKRTVDPDLERKADAIFLEAVNADEEGRHDDAYMLLRRAHVINPGDPYISGALAEYTVGMGVADSLMLEDAYEAIRARFEANPADEHNALVYASFAREIGRIDDMIHVWEVLDSLMPARTDPAMNLATGLMMRYSQKLDRADFDRAMAIYDRLEAAAGSSLALASRKIGAYMLQKDTAAIVHEIEKLAESAPADVNTLVTAGRISTGVGRLDDALTYYDRAAAIDPADGKVYLGRAYVYQSRQDSVAYDREVFRALQAPAVDYQDKFQLLTDYVVKLYADTMQQPRIEQMFETIQEVNPGEASLHALYGAYKASIEQQDAALEQFNYSIELDPTQENVWQNLVQIYSMREEPDNVLKASRRALVYFPGDPYLTLNGAFALAQQERLPQAIALLDSVDFKLVRNRSVASTIYATRGDFHYRMGDRDSAHVDYNRAIEADPDNYMALNNSAYYMTEDTLPAALDRAELYASIATAAEPTNATFLDTYAWVFFKKKDYAKAREIIDRALEAIAADESDRTQGNAEVYHHAGDIYFMDGDHRRAIELWSKALELNPDNELLARKVKHKTFFYE